VPGNLNFRPGSVTQKQLKNLTDRPAPAAAKPSMASHWHVASEPAAARVQGGLKLKSLRLTQ
jgi:hypothetical protein